MKNSFKLFSVIAGLLVILIILRLNSISYPRDFEDNTEVIYLEGFHQYGNIFDIYYTSPYFRLLPLSGDIRINGMPAVKPTVVGDNDLISVGNHRFLMTVYPSTTSYREIYRRPMIEAFTKRTPIKYIGGWTIESRRDILSRQSNRALLKKLLVELAAKELIRIVPDAGDFDGKLLILREKKDSIPPAIEIFSPHIPLIRVREHRAEIIEKGKPAVIQDGDILKIHYRLPGPGEALLIKFNIRRSRALTYLSISYKQAIPAVPKTDTGQAIASLKSLDTGTGYSINNNRKNAFIGSKGLFSFTLHPARLINKLYIPDKIPEGGMIDVKELLDLHMYYRKENRYYPVTPDFLSELKKVYKKSDRKQLLNYYKEHNLSWRTFSDYSQFKDYASAAKDLLRKMRNKGNYQVFSREIAKLNRGHHLLGIGLGIDKELVEKVTYTSAGQSTLDARRINENIPIINGIDNFYWGTRIKDSDDPVHFTIRFKSTPPAFSFIAAADYRLSVDGRTFTDYRFSDGPQTVRIPKGKRDLLVTVKNVHTFNRTLGYTNFQMKVQLKGPAGEEVNLVTGDDWEASINGFHWSPVWLNPPYSNPHPSAPDLPSIWYYETWNPLYRGMRSRYFKTKFRVESLPQSVYWKIFANGDYILRVNRKTIGTQDEFLAALQEGDNTLTVMISRKGYRKHFYVSPMFAVKGDRLLLKQKLVQRASFKRSRLHPLPFITDSTGTPLAYSSMINGKSKRFFTPGTLPQLTGFFGNPDRGGWGLEQIFSKLSGPDKVTSLQLTINRDWQAIVLDAMKKILYKNREQELKHPRYKRLKKDLQNAQAKMREKRGELSAANAADRQAVMQEVVRLQDEIEKLERRIRKVKNHFYEASVILMTPGGEIRTAASFPYDDETMNALNPDISKPYRPGENPFFNRTWQWKYNPGSTAKILGAIAMLYSINQRDETGHWRFPYIRSLFNPFTTYSKNFPRRDLKGSTMLNGKEITFRLRNFQGEVIPEGFCSFRRAFAHSYNTYFSFMALHNHSVLTADSMVYDYTGKKNDLNRRRFIVKANIPVEQTYKEYPYLEFAEKLLMNDRIDLLYNMRQTPVVSKLDRTPFDAFMTVESRFPVNAYTPANVAHYSIGQGDFQLTTLHNAILTSTVLNRGILYRPSIIQAIVMEKPGNQEKVIPLDPEKGKARVFSTAIADHIKLAMKDVVDHGTADILFRKLKKGRQFYAKTGTAETEIYKDNSLFTGFVIFKDGTPLIFSVIVPRSGIGARVAGRLTEEIVKALIAYEKKKGRTW
jgi:cell division protein FtsI/penicillin-binding protein 2